MRIVEIKKALVASIWFMFLTFPIMVIRVNTIENTIEWRWVRMLLVGVGAFVGSLLWRYLIKRKEMGTKESDPDKPTLVARLRQKAKNPALSAPNHMRFRLFAARC